MKVNITMGTGPITKRYNIKFRKQGRKWVADITEQGGGDWTQTTKPFPSESEASLNALALIKIHDDAVSIGGDANDCD